MHGRNQPSLMPQGRKGPGAISRLTGRLLGDAMSDTNTTPANDQGQPVPENDARTAPTGTKTGISKESMYSLGLVSEDFVFITTGDKPYYRRDTRKCLTEKGFQMRCTERYGHAVVTKLDKDGNATEVRKNLAVYWGDPDFTLPSRIAADYLVFVPTTKSEAEDRETNPEVHNTWHDLKGEMVAPATNVTDDDVEPFISHLMFISGGDAVGVMFFLCWLAQLYQTPGIKLPTAILLYSKFGGVGKTILWKLLKEVFGRSMVGSCSGANLQKAFDDVTENKRLLFVNEMAKSDRADGYERFKNQISEEQISFEGKGKAARDIANVTHYIVTTNNGDALPLMEKDRRVCVLACEEEPKEPSYYKALGAWMEGPGPGLLAAFLRDFKFPADWDYRAPVPQTAASRAMQQAGKSDLRLLVEDLIERRRDPFHRDFSPVGELCASLNGNHAHRGQLSKDVNQTSLGKVLRDLCGEQIQFRVKRKDEEARPVRVALWRNPEHWVEGATPEQRGEHLDNIAAPRVFAVQGGVDHERA